MYIWEHEDWPRFFWDSEHLTELLAESRHSQGRLLGRMEAIGFDLQEQARLEALTSEVVKTSEIEGEKLDLEEVRSSLASRLGIDIGGVTPVSLHTEGIVDVMVDATSRAEEELTEERLLGWHRALFPTDPVGRQEKRAGNWRDDARGPMQVVSGPVTRRRVHFQAPPAERIPREITEFLEWLNSGQEIPLIKSGIAHLWFITIHPFEDGNGRIARAVAEMVLARSEDSASRFYSMSARIEQERKEYYRILERTQSGSMNVTPWLTWFLACHERAVASATGTLEHVLRKARFWRRFAEEPFSERQVEALNRLLDGIEGKLTSTKWARMAGCSQDTAHRDILDLVERGALVKNPGGGRSTSYSLADARTIFVQPPED